MPATLASPSAPASESATLTKFQKLAALLVMLGPDSAVHVLKNLDDQELELVTTEMTKFTMVSQELQADILRDFSEVAVAASTSVRGGVEYTQGVLEKSIGLFKAANVISRIAPSRPQVTAMQEIVALEPRQIFNLIKHEQPQAIALIASYMPADKASHLMMMLRAEVRDQVIERLATLAPTPVEVIEKIVQVIHQKLRGGSSRALSQTGGVKSAADLLNALDKILGESLLTTIEERNPDLGQAIRQKMFTFEDVGRLDMAALQKVLREVDMRDLAVALKPASEALKSTLLGCISKRAAETVTEEISFLGPLKLRDIEAAQLRIIEVVRRLRTEGEIEIGDVKNESRDEVLA
jgi:flagellar motor switch protein FliG